MFELGSSSQNSNDSEFDFNEKLCMTIQNDILNIIDWEPSAADNNECNHCDSGSQLDQKEHPDKDRSNGNQVSE